MMASRYARDVQCLGGPQLGSTIASFDNIPVPSKRLDAGSLTVSPFTIALQLDGNRHHLNPFLGSALRGILGRAFQAQMCSTGTLLCPPCPERQICNYAYVFETPSETSVANLIKRFTSPPRPYVISVPFPYDGSAKLDLGLTLIGHARSLLPGLLDALRRAGELGIGQHPTVHFRVVDVALVSLCAGESTTNRLGAVSLADLTLPNDPETTQIELEWLTPLRIKRFGGYLREVERLSFAALFDILLARIEALAAVHCGGVWKPDCELRGIAERVTMINRTMRLQRLQRYSNRKRATHPIDGIVGRVTAAGPLGSLLPYLRMGTLVHVGNGADFGLGGYRLLPACADSERHQSDSQA